jgi:hypothetical protein
MRDRDTIFSSDLGDARRRHSNEGGTGGPGEHPLRIPATRIAHAMKIFRLPLVHTKATAGRSRPTSCG